MANTSATSDSFFRIVFTSELLSQLREDDSKETVTRWRTLRRLLPLVTGSENRRAIEQALEGAFAPSQDEADDLRKLVFSSLAVVLLHAAVALYPEAEPSHLNLDLDIQGEEANIWISESMGGGAGIVERVAQVISQEPALLFQNAESALNPSDFEAAMTGLECVLDTFGNNGPFESQLRQIRESVTTDERITRMRELDELICSERIGGGRLLMVCLSSRLLAPGSSEDTDTTFAEILRSRRELEDRLGVDLPVTAAMAAIPRDSRFFWPRSSELRKYTLAWTSSYDPNWRVDVGTLRGLIPCKEFLDVHAEGWLETARRRLGERGFVWITVRATAGEDLYDGIFRLMSGRVEHDIHRFFPTVRLVDYEDGRYSALVVCEEMLR